MARLSENMRVMLEDQVRHELRNSMIYEQVRAWCEYEGFNNCGEFFKKQAEEEREHFQKIFDYVMDKNDVLNLAPFAFDGVAVKFGEGALRDMFELSMETELGTTIALDAIYKAALESGDFMTSHFALEMVHIQREEENTFQSILDRFNRYPASPSMEHDLDIWIGETFND